MEIHNVFGLGYRCYTDRFLDKFLNIRKYSSPFSYMVIDLELALKFIDEDFKNYTNKEFIINGNNTFKFNKKKWTCNYIHKYSIIKSNFIDILDTKTVCIWNHHNLNDINTINSLNRRANHLIKCIKTEPKKTLLIHITKLQKSNNFDYSILKKYRYNFLIIIPILGFNSEPVLHYDSSNIKIIHFNANNYGYSADIDKNEKDYNKLKLLIEKIYKFNIKDRINI
jgi:hypothetical protein